MLLCHHQNPRTLLSHMTVDSILQELRRRGSPKAREGMSRFGIQTSKALGVSIPQIRDLAKKIGIDHELAQQLWITGIHEARILATMVDDPAKVSEGQMDKWALDFDSWDVVDGCCGNLFDKTKFAIGKAHEWSKRKEEYVKRAGNWAVRQIGKRNSALNAAAIRTCHEIAKSESRSAKWIAADALRELTSAPIRKRLAGAKAQGSR